MRIGRVRLIGRIGGGGMGEVFRGHHEILGIDVAVKLMRGRVDTARFVSEAQLAARVRHPHVVAIHDAGVDDGRFYLVMEHLPGPDLRHFIQHVGPLGWRKAAGLAAQAARGLGAAHAAGIVHRDVKPANLILDANGQVKVADLGLARALDGRDPSTVTGDLLGTPGFMAPEQAFDPRSVDARADIYGLGATLLFLLTGNALRPGDQRPPVPVDVPPALGDLLDRMLATRPRRRPADGAAAASELEAILACPLRARTTRRRALVAAALSAAICLLLATRAVIAQPVPRAAAPTPAPHAGELPGVSVEPPNVPKAKWRTSERAVFLLNEGVPARALGDLHEALFASGLRVIERMHVDRVLAEIRRSQTADLADPATSVAVARVVVGHVAVIACACDGLVEVRSVVIETGEMLGYRLLAAEQAGKAATAGIDLALRSLPVRCHAQDGRLDAGSRHGLRIGDVVTLHAGTATDPGPALATSTVVAVTADQAQLDPATSRPGPLLAQRRPR